MNSQQVPLYNALVKHIENDPVSFHVPGHKFGTIFPKVQPNVFSELLKIDATEITGMDDLHSPTGVIKESQQITADYFNVRNSYYLVGGSTAGNLAAILATCKQGDEVLVQRNSHKSVMNGLRLANVKPIFIAPDYDLDAQMSINVSRETICRAMKQFTRISAIFLTSPNYYGVVGNDLSEIVELAHKHNIPVIIDEAHGAHLKIGEPFPQSAVDVGADIIIQSAHKTLPAMTMGSFLHMNSLRVDQEKLEYYLQLLQSSSPSYPIMASLELARYYLSSLTDIDKKKIIKNNMEFRRRLEDIDEINVLNDSHKNYRFDLLKLTLQSNCTLSGYEIQKDLEKQHIYTELADPSNVLLTLPLEELKDGTLLAERIKRTVVGSPIIERMKRHTVEFEEKITTLALSFTEMEQRNTTRIPLVEAEGWISSCSIIPYPPGIPVLLPGERITVSHIEHIIELKRSGARFQNELRVWNEGIEVYL